MKKMKNIAGSRKTEAGSRKPKPATSNQKTEQPGHTMTSSHSMTAKYKALPTLPRGGFYSGDCPGAAAITSLSSLFSSPRVSPTGNQDAEFSTPHSSQCGVKNSATRCGVTNSTSRSACEGLPVPDSYRDNQPETNGFPWYCHPAGRYSGQGSSSHPERPLQRTNTERRYAYDLN